MTTDDKQQSEQVEEALESELDQLLADVDELTVETGAQDDQLDELTVASGELDEPQEHSSLETQPQLEDQPSSQDQPQLEEPPQGTDDEQADTDHAVSLSEPPADQTDEVEQTDEPATQDGTELSDQTDTQVQLDDDAEHAASEEIDEVITRIESREQGSDVIVIPRPFSMLINLLTTVDRVFAPIPQPLKNWAGYLGLSTLLFGIMLWITILLR